MSGASDSSEWGAGGASEPRLEPLSYGGPDNIFGHPPTVAQIHRTNRLFDLLQTMTLAGLASIVTIVSGLVAIYGPDTRSSTVLFMAISGWFIAAGLGGFAAFRIKVSKTGVDVSGTGAATPSTSLSAGRRQKTPT